MLSHTRNPGSYLRTQALQGRGLVPHHVSCPPRSPEGWTLCLDGTCTVERWREHSHLSPFPNSSNLCFYFVLVTDLLLSLHYLYKVRGESITISILQMMNRGPKKCCVPRRSKSGSVAFGLQRLFTVTESLQFLTGALSRQTRVQSGLLGLPAGTV